MENVIGEFISQWGPLGILAILATYIIYERIRVTINADKKSSDNQDIKCADHLNENNLILSSLSEFKDNIDLKFELVGKTMERNIDDIKQTFNSRHEVLTKRLANLEDRLKNQPRELANNLMEIEINRLDDHNKKLLNHIELGPVIHRIFSRYLDIIGCDHIVLGAFHNGSSTLSGIPYCKFDIIVEKYNVKENIHDTDFASIYKNTDLLIHNKLPSALIQNTYIYFNITDNPRECELDDIDDILYRRALGRGIKQLAFHLLRDMHNIPIGFICCINFTEDKMVEREIPNCARELENIYNSQL